MKKSGKREHLARQKTSQLVVSLQYSLLISIWQILTNFDHFMNNFKKVIYFHHKRCFWWYFKDLKKHFPFQKKKIHETKSVVQVVWSETFTIYEAGALVNSHLVTRFTNIIQKNVLNQLIFNIGKVILKNNRLFWNIKKVEFIF